MEYAQTRKQFDQWLEDSAPRFTDEFVETRLLKEQRKTDSINLQESKLKHRLFSVRSLLPRLLRLSGLLSIGQKSASRIRLTHNDLPIAGLPASFQGFKLLHISDLHFNGNERLLNNLLDKIRQTDYDYCVFTGDYRFRSFGSIDMAMQGLETVRSAVKKDCVAILGNHDSLTMVPFIEALNIRVLVNEHLDIKKGSDIIRMVGVDDPSYYKTHNLTKAIGKTSEAPNRKTCNLLLAHSPNLILEAEQLGLAAYLCGHTHGGQICLPGGKPIVKSTKLPRWSRAGRWQHRLMPGYTSVGAGTSIVEVRFFCPPEITVHTLVSA